MAAHPSHSRIGIPVVTWDYHFRLENVRELCSESHSHIGIVTGQDETLSPTSLVCVKAGTVRLQRDGRTGEPGEPRLTEIEDIA